MEQQPETFEQAFEKLNTKVIEAFNSSDIKTCVESYTEDATLLLADRPPIKGWKAIEAALQEYADAGAKLLPVEQLETRSSGDMGVCVGTYAFEMPLEGSAPVKQRGKFVTVFMRQSDGSWKAVIDSLLGDAT
jgi:ketosteroid isomerase-like protein